MSTRTYNLLETQTGSGTGGNIYDLFTSDGVDGDELTISNNSSTFGEQAAWIGDISDFKSSASDVEIALGVPQKSGTLEFRCRLQRVDSGGSVLYSGSYGSTYTEGSESFIVEDLPFSPGAWNSTDRLKLSLELRRSGGHGNVSIVLATGLPTGFLSNYSSSKVFVPVELPTVTGDLSSSYSNYSFASSGDFTSNTVTGDLAASYSNYTADFSGDYEGIPETEKLYYRDTQTEPGTGSFVSDLSTTPPPSEGGFLGLLRPLVFTKFIEFQKTIGDRLSGVDIKTSAKLGIDELRGQQVRWRLNKIDSGGTVQLTSSYSQVYSSDGIYTETLSLPTTWSSGDRINIEFEHIITSDDGISTTNPLVISTDSYIEIIVPDTVTGNLSISYSNYQFSSSADVIPEVTGDLSTSYSNYSFSSSANVGIAGDLTASYSDYSFSASGNYISPVTGDIIVSYNNYSFSSSGALISGISGDLSATYQSSDSFSASGTFENLPRIKSAAEIKNISQLKI